MTIALRATGVMLLALATTAGCDSASPDPQQAAVAAEKLLLTDRPEQALTLLEDAIRDAPADTHLRVLAARAELALGKPAMAEGSLQRALTLGAARADLVADLARSQLEQGKSLAAVEQVGELTRWPADRQPMLALVLAEAQLRLGGDERRIVRAFATAYRLRAATPAGDRDRLERHTLDRRLDLLRQQQPLARAGFEHFACRQPDAEQSRAILSTPPAVSAGRRVLQVGPTRTLRRPSDAARVAQDHDVVEIDAGEYSGDVAVWSASDLLLRGVGGRPHLIGRGALARDQGIWVIAGNDVVVANLEFSNAHNRSRNGSGIRAFGRNLRIVDSYFHDNDAGLLTWKDPDSDIVIEHSEFARNGYGDGQSHNIYIGSIRSFTLRYSHSHDSHNGQEVKSRAASNHILYNRLTDEEDGDSSYLIDLPYGGDAFVIGNELQKGFRSQNPFAIAYASERRGITSGQLVVMHNSFFNARLNTVFVANRSERPALIANNVLTGVPAGVLEGPGTNLGNVSLSGNGLVAPAALDFTPTPDSRLIDAALPLPPWSTPLQLPEFEYRHPLSGQPRQSVGRADIGAHEFCGW